MLTAFCSRMDDLSMLSYLETDKYENVRFYRRLGFAVVAEAEVLGGPNWFMSRPGGATLLDRARSPPLWGVNTFVGEEP
jgi:hypothetical protein